MPELRAPYQSRARVTYPKKERFSIRSKPNCENKEIINTKQFYIDRYRQASYGGPDSRFRWIAILNPSTPRSETPLAYLNAERGACNDIYTHKGSKNCGIGRAMLLLCLNDDDIIGNGGYNPLDDPWEDEDLGESARELCKAIVVLSCNPKESTPPIVCKMYMDTARTAGYHLVFIEKDYDNKYKRLKIDSAKSIFENNPEDFLDEMGNQWYFCKCKPNKLKDCKGMFCYFILWKCAFESLVFICLIII